MAKFTWNHRVIKRTYENGEVQYGIYEVHYDGKKIYSCTADAMEVLGETFDELEECYEQMGQAFDAPVLNYEDI